MSKIVKSILKEELDRIKALGKKYAEEINQCPPGYLLKRQRNNNNYYYLSYREEGKIKQDYLGKLSSEEVKKMKGKMKLKKQFRQQLKETREHIKYLEKLLKK